MEKIDVEQVEVKDIAHHEPSPDEVIAASDQRSKRSALERRLLLKADLVIVPLISVAYLASYLASTSFQLQRPLILPYDLTISKDRNSIGNARIMGLQMDLHMNADQFYNCLTMFFVGYAISMLPANLTARKFKPNRSLGVAVVFFGVCCCGMAEARNYATILALRICLGIGQGFIQMAPIYCSLWYRRDELATRSSIYYACATVSGAFGGLIAYGVQSNLASTGGRKPWSWLFLIEGVLAIGVGLLIIVALPRFPDDLHRREKRHWLFTSEEIELAYKRYNAYNAEGDKFRTKQLVAVVKDVKTYFFSFIQSAAVLGVSVVGSFLPTFIHDFGFSPVRTQLFTVIPYALAFVTVITVGYLSDRWNTKGPFLFVSCCIGCIGYILLITVSSMSARVVATCLVTAGCYPIGILLPVWLSINTPNFTKRGATWAFSEVFGIAFSIMGTRIYTGPPRYYKGHGTVLGFFAFAAINVAAAYLWMRKQNVKKNAILEDYARRGEIHPHIARRMTLEALQDEHIAFRRSARYETYQ